MKTLAGELARHRRELDAQTAAEQEVAAEAVAQLRDAEAARDPECVYLLDSGDVCGNDGTVFRVRQVVGVGGNAWGAVRSSGPAGKAALLCPTHVLAALTPADGDPLAAFLVEVVAEAAS